MPIKKNIFEIFHYIQTINFLKYVSYTIFWRKKKSDIVGKVFIFNQRVQGFNFFSIFFLPRTKWMEEKNLGQVEYLNKKGIFLGEETKWQPQNDRRGLNWPKEHFPSREND